MKRKKLTGARRNDALFRQGKVRVGQAARAAANATNVALKAKLVRVGEQRNISTVAKGRVVTEGQNLTMGECFAQLRNSNGNSRKKALLGVAELLRRFPESFVGSTGALLTHLTKSVTDDEPPVRAAARDCLRELLLCQRRREDGGGGPRVDACTRSRRVFSADGAAGGAGQLGAREMGKAAKDAAADAAAEAAAADAAAADATAADAAAAAEATAAAAAFAFAPAAPAAAGSERRVMSTGGAAVHRAEERLAGAAGPGEAVGRAAAAPPGTATPPSGFATPAAEASTPPPAGHAFGPATPPPAAASAAAVLETPPPTAGRAFGPAPPAAAGAERAQPHVDARLLVPFADRLGLLVRSALSHRSFPIRAEVLLTLRMLLQLSRGAEALLPRVMHSAATGQHGSPGDDQSTCAFLGQLFRKAVALDGSLPREKALLQLLAAAKFANHALRARVRLRSGDTRPAGVDQLALAFLCGGEPVDSSGFLAGPGGLQPGLARGLAENPLVGAPAPAPAPAPGAPLVKAPAPAAAAGAAARAAGAAAAAAGAAGKTPLEALLATVGELYSRVSFMGAERGDSSPGRKTAGAARSAPGPRQPRQPAWDSARVATPADAASSCGKAVKFALNEVLASVQLPAQQSYPSAGALLRVGTRLELLRSLSLLLRLAPPGPVPPAGELGRHLAVPSLPDYALPYMAAVCDAEERLRTEVRAAIDGETPRACQADFAAA